MTTDNDDYQERKARFGSRSDEEALDDDLFGNPEISPKQWYRPSINPFALGAEVNSLNTGGGKAGTKIESRSTIASTNTRNRSIVTATGHAFELDDTPGNERILIRHNSGNGIELQTDGSMLIVTKNQNITISADQTIVIEGDATIQYGGNVDMKIGGDYNVNVAGNYNVTVGENKTEAVEGSSRTTVEGNTGFTVKGNASATFLKNITTTVLANSTTAVKGISRNTSEGNMIISSGAIAKFSAKEKLFQASTNMNIAASDISIFGSSGTFGGENIVYYGKGGTFSEGVTAPTFHGDLDGTADTAETANSQSYADPSGGGGVGSAGSITNTATPTTEKPTQTIIDNLNKTAYGAGAVFIDVGDKLLQALNKSTATDGLSSRNPTTSETRAALRIKGIRGNSNFIGNQVANGILSENFGSVNPPPINRISSNRNSDIRGRNNLGQPIPGSAATFKRTGNFKSYNYLPYTVIPDSFVVKKNTKLVDGVNLANFLGGTGTSGRFNQIPTNKRAQYARNLQLNAEIVKRLRDNIDPDFKDHRLVVVEGLYNPTDAEKNAEGFSESVNYFRSQGRAVVYELHDLNGNIDYEKTYDLAVLFKNILAFEKIILDYDNYDGDLNSQIIVIMPELNENYKVTSGGFTGDLETRFNNSITSSSDLVEHQIN